MRDDQGYLPLHIVIGKGLASAATVRAILDAFPLAVHVPDCKGRTPIALSRKLPVDAPMRKEHYAILQEAEEEFGEITDKDKSVIQDILDQKNGDDVYLNDIDVDDVSNVSSVTAASRGRLGAQKYWCAGDGKDEEELTLSGCSGVLSVYGYDWTGADEEPEEIMRSGKSKGRAFGVLNALDTCVAVNVDACAMCCRPVMEKRGIYENG